MIDYKHLSKRDKAIMIGLFLSKYDKKALDSFGFAGFKEAFNVLGYAVETPPSSIKNYRDEFDPYYPNPRQGWHHRELRDYCRDIIEMTQDLTFEMFHAIINSFVVDEYVDVSDIKSEHPITSERKFLANRIITGKAAEEYFVMNYRNIPTFSDFNLTDTTNQGCGFDYKLSLDTANIYVEVKGINNRQGSILMTEKEHNMAEDLLDRYCLFVVSNFKDSPMHQLFFDPLHCDNLLFHRQERQVIQITYSTNIPGI